MQLLQMAQQQQARREALDANAGSQARAQAFNAQQAGMDRAFKAGMFGADFAADRIRAGEEMGLAGMREEAAWDRAAMSADMIGERSRLAAEETGRRSADHDRRMADMYAARDREDWLAAGLKAGDFRYTESQKRDMARLQGEMHKAQMNPDLTPDEQQSVVGELQGQFERVRQNPFTARPDEKPPSTGEKVQSMTQWMVGPDGKRRQYQVQVRNGVEQVDVVAEEETDDAAAKHAASFRGKTKTVKGKLGETSQEQYTAQDIADAWDAEQEALRLIRGGERQKPEGQAKFGGGMQLPPQGPPQPGPGATASAPSPLQKPQYQPGQLLNDEKGQTFWVDPQSGQPLPVFPRNSQAATQEGNLVVDETGTVFLVQGQGQYQPVGKVAEQEAEIPVGKDGIHRPRTPQEAASLPPGTTFMTPDGRRKVVPNG